MAAPKWNVVSRGLGEAFLPLSSGVDRLGDQKKMALNVRPPMNMERLHSCDFWSEEEVAFYLSHLDKQGSLEPPDFTASRGASSSRDHLGSAGNSSFLHSFLMPAVSCWASDNDRPACQHRLARVLGIEPN
jgi:hypothetical protein